MNEQTNPTPTLRECTILVSDTGELITGLFTKDQISEVPPGKYLYHIRHSDYSSSIPRTIEPRVIVNRYGYLLTDHELNFPDPTDKYISIERLRTTKRKGE